MHPWRPALTLTALALLMATTGCEPGQLTSIDSADPAADSCCEDPVPTLADARSKAMAKDAAVKDATFKDAVINTDATGAKSNTTPATPSRIDSKQPETATDKLPPLPPAADRDKLDLDFNFADQDAKPFNLKAIAGKVTVATFIFTRCPNPNMCPLQGVKIAALQSRLEKAGLSDKVNLLVFTFDPTTDTPAVLNKWGQTQGIKYTNAKMLRPDLREFSDFQFEWGFRAGPTPDGTINHQTDLMLIDQQSRLAAFYGGLWNDDQILEQVKELIAE